ncbi:MAG: hypothetical protein WBM32_05840 [Crocosphaera sp.]|jgi:hypothetical protein
MGESVKKRNKSVITMEFDLLSTGFSNINAAYLAQCSDIAYKPESEIEEELRKHLNYVPEYFTYFSSPTDDRHDTQGFIQKLISLKIILCSQFL